MIDWYFSLPRATWKQRLLAAAMLSVLWLNFILELGRFHDDLAIARWIAWVTSIAAIFMTPMCLVVLFGGRAPRSFARPDLLAKTLPQIHREIRREHEERGRNARRF